MRERRGRSGSVGSSRRQQQSNSSPSVATSSASSSSPAEISNSIKRLLKQSAVATGDVRADAARLDELRKLFVKLETSGELVFVGGNNNNNNANDNDDNNNANDNVVTAKWNAFLLKSHKSFVHQLCDRIQYTNSIGGSRHASVRCLWGVLGGSPLTMTISPTTTTTSSSSRSSSSSYKVLNSQLLKRWMKAMVERDLPATSSSTTATTAVSSTTNMDQGLRHMVESEFLQPYRDVQYYSLGCLTGLATELYNNTKMNNRVTEEEEEEGNTSDDTNDDTSTSRRKKGGDRTTTTTTSTIIADRLLELLMMIPVPTSQKEIDQSSNFLIPPPPPSTDVSSTNDDDDDDSDDSDDDDDDRDDESESSDDEWEKKSNGATTSNQSNSYKKNSNNKNKGNKLSFQQMKMFRREYQRAWLAVLRLPQLSSTALKRALHFLPEHVLMYVNHPLRFADFFMQAYSTTTTSSSSSGGGIIGVLALDGLFLLITEHELEYPNFYKQLYKLVTPPVMHVKYRARFFGLLNKCLVRNEMLPAHIVAAFIKRLCRCAMSCPPPAILFVLALVSNLIRKHPECSCLIHRNNSKSNISNDEDGDGNIEDGFDADQDDPVKAGALQSSLWELVALENHYLPAISTMAKSIGSTEEINTPAYNIMSDFTQHTYGSLFDQERKRYHQPKHPSQQGDGGGDDNENNNPKSKKRKTNKTALSFTEPKSLFSESDVFADFLSL